MNCFRFFACTLLFSAAVFAQETPVSNGEPIIVAPDASEIPLPAPSPLPTPISRVPKATIAKPVAPKSFKDNLIVRGEVFGTSVKKRPIRAWILENNTPRDTRNITLIFAAVHGNEIGTPGVVEALRTHLRRHPIWVRGRRVLLIPVLNPDGLARRSRRNARNVDINRNYPGTWQLTSRGGPSAASEPETRAMIRFVAKYRPTKIVSIHQPLHCIAYSGERSRALAQTIARANKYRITDNIGYPTPGGFGGYCSLIIQTPVVTLELPWQSAARSWQQNSQALLNAIAL